MSTASSPTPKSVLQMSRTLLCRPALSGDPSVRVRPYSGESDIDLWLRIRERAFAAERVGVRKWTRDDFRRELLQKPWWSPERLWIAETIEHSTRLDEPAGTAVGTVALADRPGRDKSMPAVHWLAVLPRYRRLGVGQMLMATLEAYCWDRGWKEIALETHTKWRRAASFYAALGYTTTDDVLGPADRT